jgi:8-oxo-dGTP pyrophosphatase MutT (NUDIX family)
VGVEITNKLRVAAYALCVTDGRILLARWVGPDGKRWTLPGGGIDHGEDPYEAVIREVDEETGYRIEVRRLLGVHTVRRRHPRGPAAEVDFHGLRILYEAEVVGGELRFEVDGSTDRAQWFDLDEIAGLRHSNQIDIALELARTSPPDGRGDVALPLDERLIREGPEARTGPPPGS